MIRVTIVKARERLLVISSSLAVFTALFILFSNTSYPAGGSAPCSKPGQLNIAGPTPQFCDGTIFVSMKSAARGGCSKPNFLSGTANDTTYCDGKNLWSIVGPSKGTTCSNPGTLFWSVADRAPNICLGGTLYLASTPTSLVQLAFQAKSGRLPSASELSFILAGLDQSLVGQQEVSTAVDQYLPQLAPAVLTISPTATDWLVKDVCADGAGNVLAFDPYFNCPYGSSRRKIRVGDPLPYFNRDMRNEQSYESFPLLDANNNPLYINTHDWAPFGDLTINAASDGFDVFAVKNGWVQFTETRDGGGFGTNWKDASGDLGGYFIFPSTGFQAGGQVPNSRFCGQYWEQDGYSFPGAPCDTIEDTAVWSMQRIAFGGINGYPSKTMDTLAVYTGVTPGGNGHMEVFYFTRQYGLTRYEHWAPSGADPKPTKTLDCMVPDVKDFQGHAFVISGCHDASNVVLASTSQIPVVPIPESNLLGHAHFDSSWYGSWGRAGKSVEGNIINWGSLLSKSVLDTYSSDNKAGVAYLATNCAGTCTGPNVQQIYQELPIANIRNNGTYLYGVDARLEPGGAASGKITITLQQIDSSDQVVWSDSFSANISADNGNNWHQERKVGDSMVTFSEDTSVYLSSALVKKVVTIPVIPTANRLKFIITPETSWVNYQILDAWFNPYPAVTGRVVQGSP